MKEMIYKPNRETEILDEGYIDNLHYCIISFGTHPCAYVELPETHKYYKTNYFNIDDIDACHGGLTYSSEHGIFRNDDKNHKDGFWIGWDYNHCDDYAGYEQNFPVEIQSDGKKWTTEEILEEVKNVIAQLNQV